LTTRKLRTTLSISQGNVAKAHPNRPSGQGKKMDYSQEMKKAKAYYKVEKVKDSRYPKGCHTFAARDAMGKCLLTRTVCGKPDAKEAKKEAVQWFKAKFSPSPFTV
jgi:hypothetical protein